MSSVFIFNQYYIDLLKRIKSRCKENKEDDNSSRVLKSIKATYSTLDKSSHEYIDFLNNQISEDDWKCFLEDDDWIKNNQKTQLYNDISLDDITKLFEDDYLQLHFLSVFYIFRTEREEEENTTIVKILQSPDDEKIEQLNDGNIKKLILRLSKLRNEKVKEKSGIDMKFIEDTTLGKLAKEIIQDIDIGKMQKSIDEKGDVLKAIGDPDSGFAEIITSVSQKMANKISNGELKQENIIQDAVKLASSMPGLMGGMGGSGKNDTPDLSSMMQMMSSMMGNNNMQNVFKNMAGASGNKKKGQRPVFNEGALKKMAAAKKMKNKLRMRQNEKNDKPE